VSLGSSLKMHSLVQGPADSRCYYEADERNTGFFNFSVSFYFTYHMCVYTVQCCVQKAQENALLTSVCLRKSINCASLEYEHIFLKCIICNSVCCFCCMVGF
jgi:hypothetical protein